MIRLPPHIYHVINTTANRILTKVKDGIDTEKVDNTCFTIKFEDHNEYLPGPSFMCILIKYENRDTEYKARIQMNNLQDLLKESTLENNLFNGKFIWILKNGRLRIAFFNSKKHWEATKGEEIYNKKYIKNPGPGVYLLKNGHKEYYFGELYTYDENNNQIRGKFVTLSWDGEHNTYWLQNIKNVNRRYVELVKEIDLNEEIELHRKFCERNVQEIEKRYDTYYSYYNSHTSLEEYKREQLDTKNNKKLYNLSLTPGYIHPLFIDIIK